MTSAGKKDSNSASADKTKRRKGWGDNQAPKSKTTTDIIVDEWKKNAREVVRVMLQVYEGKNVISIRTWYRGPDGLLRAGRNGITLGIAKHLPKLRTALKQARKLAKTFPHKAKGGL